MSDRSGPTWAWRHLWKSGRTVSCAPENSATAAEIDDHWRRYFANLPTASRILDVATGNGAVLRQAATVSTKSFDLVGIDLAEIDPIGCSPDDFSGPSKISFIGQIDASNLPFSDSSFDFAVSQYGLEYANLDRGLDELARILRPGGQLHWIAHNQESEVVRQNHDHRGQVDFLLRQNGALDQMEALVERITRKKSVKLPMLRLARRLTEANEFCRTNPPAAILIEVCGGFADIANKWQAYDPQDLKAMIVRTRRELIAHRQRIADLNHAVLTDVRIEILVEKLSSKEWENASMEPFIAGKNSDLLGTLISATRA